MGSLIYIAAIVLIAIFTNLNKASKNKGKTAPRGGMPTFGGGGNEGNPLRRSRVPARSQGSGRPDRSGSGFPQPDVSRTGSRQLESSPGGRDYDTSPAWPERADSPSPDYETGEGMSLEQADDRDSVQARTDRMQRELERQQAAFDGMAAAVPSTGSVAPGEADKDSLAASGKHPLAGNREALRSGLLWAEILGPPRSRQPHSTRREG
ncbi:hypothetical protein KC345_g10262 [Hortaea werneckii]|nr:hypothetical protein KC345_g10262 [Hortaea werneckii]